MIEVEEFKDCMGVEPQQYDTLGHVTPAEKQDFIKKAIAEFREWMQVEMIPNFPTHHGYVTEDEKQWIELECADLEAEMQKENTILAFNRVVRNAYAGLSYLPGED